MAAGALIAGPTAVAQPAADEGLVELRFSEFFVSPVGPRGLVMTPRLQAADGRRVRITGYMVAQEQPTPGRFFLTPRPVLMSDEADGPADDLPPSTVTVLLPDRDKDALLPHTRGLLRLTGVLHVGRDVLADGRVSWVRLALDPRPTVTPAAASSNQDPISTR